MEFHRIQNAIDLLGPAKAAPRPAEQAPGPTSAADSGANGDKPREGTAPAAGAETRSPSASAEMKEGTLKGEAATGSGGNGQMPASHGAGVRTILPLPSAGSTDNDQVPASSRAGVKTILPLPSAGTGGNGQMSAAYRAGVKTILPLPVPAAFNGSASRALNVEHTGQTQAPNGSTPRNGDASNGDMHLESQTALAIAPIPPDEASGFEPKLGIAWGDFHQGVASSIGALVRRPFGRGPRDEQGRPITCPYLRDTRVDGRTPVRAVIAAGLWHVAILALPISLFTGLPHRNPAFQNVQLTWAGPINDLPLLEIPRELPKAKPVEAPKPLPVPPVIGADAFHPRQRIFTDPVRPNHPRQTLIQPAAPNLAPKLLPRLPNMVLFQVAGPAKPRMQITEEMLKRPREKRNATATVQAQNAPSLEQHVSEFNLPTEQNGPARPKLELNAGAAPRAAQRRQTGENGPAPELGATQITAANGGAQALIAISANPAPPAPVQPPPGNLAARVAISPEGKTPGKPAGDAASSTSGGKNSVGISISGGNPGPSASGGDPSAKISAPSPRLLITKPDPKLSEDVDERTSPPDFASLPPGAKPEIIFASRRVYTLNVNMPNLNSSTGSWILNFSEFRAGGRPKITTNDLSGPVPMKKVDPKYPQTLIAERVAGEVILYAIIRRDGSVDSIQVVRGIDRELDANAMRALAQWQFRPALKQGVPVELEAIVHIPFRLPEEY